MYGINWCWLKKGIFEYLESYTEYISCHAWTSSVLLIDRQWYRGQADV